MEKTFQSQGQQQELLVCTSVCVCACVCVEAIRSDYMLSSEPVVAGIQLG